MKPLEKRAQEAERQLEETVKLLEQEQTQLAKVESTVQQQAEELSVLSSGKSNVEAELKPLEKRAQEAERQLEETVKLLEQEQAQLVAIQKTAQEHDAELHTQQSRVLELETNAKSLESQIQAAGEKLEQMTDELDKTKSLQIELEKITEQQKAQLNQKEIQYTQLEAKLRETVESNSDKHSSESERLERQGLKLDELQFALQNEKEQRLELLEKMKSGQIRIAELEQQSQASSVNESNYKEMAKKVVKYKTAYRESKADLEEIAEQKSNMSELATEYLTAAKTLKGELDAQLKITAELQRRLDGASSNSVNPSDLDLLVQERARAHVLSLKEQFEERIKKKNALIRKLKNRESVQS